MGQIVVESTAVSVADVSSPLVITKPAGLAEGDLLIFAGTTLQTSAFVSIGFSLPAGWTSAAVHTSAAGVATAIYYKVADASDVSASNFSFTYNGSANRSSGTLIRCSNFFTTSIVEGSFTDGGTSESTTSVSVTGTANITVPNCLVVVAIALADGTNGNPVSLGTYASTPSITFTELFDDNSTSGVGSSVVYGESVTDTDITAFSAAISGGNPDRHSVTLVAFRPFFPTSGTTALLQVDPITLNQNGVAGTLGTSDLLQVNHTIFTQSGKANTPQQWTNETKPTSTWTNEQKI